MSDRLDRALVRNAQLTAAVATTTETCRAAQAAHGLGGLATIALGRLLTATALAGFVEERRGALSVQVLGRGKLGQLFADVTDAGALRGFVRNGRLELPLLPGEGPLRRRAVGHAIGDGTLSVIRTPRAEGFTQSSTHLTSGEIDDDVAHFLQQSDQVPTALVADVLLGDDGTVARAGGVIVQALPGGDLGRLDAIRGELSTGRWADALAAGDGSPEALLSTVVQGAVRVGEPSALAWKCRCSRERVVAALRMLDPAELADMVDTRESPEVRCDFCGKKYVLTPDEVASVYRTLEKGQG